MLCLFSNCTQIALFIVRVTLGFVFMAHGSQKVFGLFGGPGLAGFAQWTNSALGTPLILGYAAAFFELIAGVLLFFGIASELGALMVIPVMLVAIFFYHWPHGFFAQNGGFEYSLVLLLLAVVILIGGPGKWYLLATPYL